jgi:hypothetical protein
MLLVFALAVTPKRFLHDAFAGHTDKGSLQTSNAAYQLTQAGYNCDNDDVVANTAFVITQNIFSFPIFTSFCPYISREISLPSPAKIYSALRGPPQKLI